MKKISQFLVGLCLGFSLLANAQVQEAPDQLVKRLSTEIIEAAKTDKDIQAGNRQRINDLVEAKVLPHINFERMTSLAVSKSWRGATPEQQKRLQDEFKLLLIRTYAGAVKEIKDQTVNVRPLKLAPEDINVIVRSEVRGKGDPIQLDYRVGKVTEGSASVWKIYDINILGVWLVETYRGQFAQEINASGIDGLIKLLAERNKGAKK